jgi:RNA polymerase sigma-70 factor (ECF subfamily)
MLRPGSGGWVDSENNPQNQPPLPSTVVPLIARHQAMVWRYVRSLGCDPALADEITQDTFIALIRSGFREMSEPQTIEYLRKIAYHLVLADRKRIARSPVTPLPPDGQLPDWLWDRRAEEGKTMEILERCLQRLSERARVAIEMKYRDESSRSEIATRLAMGEHGVKNLLQRAKEQLRECIESQLDHE